MRSQRVPVIVLQKHLRIERGKEHVGSLHGLPTGSRTGSASFE